MNSMRMSLQMCEVLGLCAKISKLLQNNGDIESIKIMRDKVVVEMFDKENTFTFRLGDS